MFLICVSYPLAEYSGSRERKLVKVAGRRSDRSGSDTDTRTLEWQTEEFAAAVELRRRLAEVDGVTAVIRES